jgi:hypothetical protein
MQRLAAEIVVGRPGSAQMSTEARIALTNGRGKLPSEHFLRRHSPVHPVTDTASWM